MAKKIYSAGLVSQRFWFYEVKQYLELRNMGKSDDVISSLSDTENIFGATLKLSVTAGKNIKYMKS